MRHLYTSAQDKPTRITVLRTFFILWPEGEGHVWHCMYITLKNETSIINSSSWMAWDSMKCEHVGVSRRSSTRLKLGWDVPLMNGVWNIGILEWELAIWTKASARFIAFSCSYAWINTGIGNDDLIVRGRLGQLVVPQENRLKRSIVSASLWMITWFSPCSSFWSEVDNKRLELPRIIKSTATVQCSWAGAIDR